MGFNISATEKLLLFLTSTKWSNFTPFATSRTKFPFTGGDGQRDGTPLDQVVAVGRRLVQVHRQRRRRRHRHPLKAGR